MDYSLLVGVHRVESSDVNADDDCNEGACSSANEVRFWDFIPFTLIVILDCDVI